jgi:thiazole synthase
MAVPKRLLATSVTGKYRISTETRALRSTPIRRRDRHRRHPPHQHRPEPGRAQPARRAAAGPYTILPNTAGCYTADDAVRTCAWRANCWMATTLVKLEVLGDPTTLFPNIRADAESRRNAGEGRLRRDGLHQRRPDPGQALEEIGCVAVMPLAAPIGSGMGIVKSVEPARDHRQRRVPVMVDAGVGTASDAAIAMELGCDGVLMNTAIAAAQNPVLMAHAR